MLAPIDLSLGTISSMFSRHQERWKEPFTGYAPRGGLKAFRSMLARIEDVPAMSVTVTSGASMALTAALSILPRGRLVLLPRPHLPAYPAIARLLGHQTAFYDMGSGLTPAEAVVKAARGRDVGAILFNTPNNPLGIVASTAEMAALETTARRIGALLIVDESQADLIFSPDDFVWRGHGAASQTVRVKSLSKAHQLPGERIGYAVAVPELIAQIEDAHWAMAMASSVSAQVNAARALAEALPQRLARLRQSLVASRDAAIEALAESCGLHVPPPRSGLFLWIQMPSVPFSGVAIARHCSEHHAVGVMPGEAFGVTDPPSIRALFAVDTATAKNAFRALGQALHEVRTAQPTDRDVMH